MKTLLHVSTFAKALVVAGLSLGLSGCLPKEAATTTPVASTSTFGLVSATTTGSTKVKLVWTPATSADAVTYKVYDVTNADKPNVIRTMQVSTGATEMTLTGLNTMNYYAFRVRVADKNGKEDNNTKDMAAIPYAGIVSSTVTSSTTATVTVTDGSNAEHIDIFCTTMLDPIPQKLATIDAPTSAKTTAILTDLRAGIEYTCRASLYMQGYNDNNTVTTVFTPMGSASRLIFATQPGSATSGNTWSTQPVIRIVDINGTLVAAGPDSTAQITLGMAPSSPTAGVINGTATAFASGGIATFTGLSMNELGNKLIRATKSDTASQHMGSPTLTQDSAQFIITADSVSPTTSTIAISPAGPLVANGSDSYTVTITLKDKFGNPVAGVKPQFSSSVAGDVITQPTVNTDTNGQSSGTIQTTIADSARILSISSPAGLSADQVTAPFIAGAAHHLKFTVQPLSAGSGVTLNAMKVAVQDFYGNTVLSGVGSDAVIGMEIYNNTYGATLSGTKSVQAVSGVATFSTLSIDKTQNNQKLVASVSVGSYNPDTSNVFNITNGVPQKIAVTIGTPIMRSGDCSAVPVIVQLQDNGSNPANATSAITLTAEGLSGALLYGSTDSLCGNTPVSNAGTGTASISITAGQGGSTPKRYYIKNNKAESISLVVKDSGNTLTQSSVNIKFTPAGLSLAAGASSLLSGRCSTSPLVITTLGADGNPGPLVSQASVAIRTFTANLATYYSDAACATTALNPAAILLDPPVGTNYTYNIYFKDNKAETLSLGINDNASSAAMAEQSSAQAINILPSALLFAGPTSVVSGRCSGPSQGYTITLKDAAGNSVNAPTGGKTLSIKGLESSTTGQFYTSNTCGGAGFKTSVTIPAGSPSVTIYFRDTAAETVTLFIRDPASPAMTDSNSIVVGVSPSAYRITQATSITTLANTVCSGAFTVTTLDGNNTTTPAITALTANLSGAGAAGAFFSDASCTAKITSLAFTTGQSTKTFYFKGQYPEALTLTASDPLAILTSGTYALQITAASGFLGTAVKTFMDGAGNIAQWFAKNLTNVTARFDGPSSIRTVHLDGTKRYMYVADYNQGRLLKYDYTNHKYIGWLGYADDRSGTYYNQGGAFQGSLLDSTEFPTATADCNKNGLNIQTPWWCKAGQSRAIGNITNGGFNRIAKIADDGANNYIYVTDSSAHAVTRYDAKNGSYKGWLGNVASQPSSSNVPVSNLQQTISNLHNSCNSTLSGSPTPGWCNGGTNQGPPVAYAGDASLNSPNGTVYSGGYLYVGVEGMIKKFDATTGVYQGWIGRVNSAPAGCTPTPEGNTPGWCNGGSADWQNPRTYPGAIQNAPYELLVLDGYLYALLPQNSGMIVRWVLATGAFDKIVAQASGPDWLAATGMTTDGTNLYVTDYNRVMLIHKTFGTVLGWIGKASTRPTANAVAGVSGCTTMDTYDNTPGWCSGGVATYGMDEGSFNRVYAIEYDGLGNLITGGREVNRGASLQQWDSATGAFKGTLAYQSASPSQWSDDANILAQVEGYDDLGMNMPMGSWVDTVNGYLYVTELGASRVKKINVKTGETIGWLGAITSDTTGGQQAACTLAAGVHNRMGASPGWCLGASYSPEWSTGQLIPSKTDGTMYQPTAVTGDGTWIYVLDRAWHRIMRFDAATGAYGGWIGRVQDRIGLTYGTGCSAANNGDFTPTWCKGGMSGSGSGDGAMSTPIAMTYISNTLYVLDAGNSRIVSYGTINGDFKGWAGRISALGGGGTGCSPVAQGAGGSGFIITNGFCKGNTNTPLQAANDSGGGFWFSANRSGIHAALDGSGNVRIYVANEVNSRIDRFDSSGVWLGGISTNLSVFSNSWSTAQATVKGWTSGNNWRPRAVWADAQFLYFTMDRNSTNNSTPVVKVDLATGNIVGWKGYVPGGSASYKPTGGDNAACTSTQDGPTPGWCQGGMSGYSFQLGGFYSASSMTADAYFLYVMDETTHRVTRLPR